MRRLRKVGCPVYAEIEEGRVSRICVENPPESSALVQNFTVIRRIGSSRRGFWRFRYKKDDRSDKARKAILVVGLRIW